MSERRFPIMDGPSVPWSMVEPYAARIKSNHDQTLERLAERGGLDPVELWCAVHGKRLREGISSHEADLWIRAWMDADWRARALAAEAKVEAMEQARRDADLTTEEREALEKLLKQTPDPVAMERAGFAAYPWLVIARAALDRLLATRAP